MLDQKRESPIKGEIFSAERLEEFASDLAAHLSIAPRSFPGKPLLKETRKNGRELRSSYRALASAIHKKEKITPAGEWLTDNFYVVEEQLREIMLDLPPTYYRALPKINLGDLSGYPRVYAISLAMIAHTGGRLEVEGLRKFLGAFQKITPLNIGELWAVPITLRIALIENLRRVAETLAKDLEKTRSANRFADRLIDHASNPKKIRILVSKLPHCHEGNLSHNCTYYAQLSSRLRDLKPDLWPAVEHLETFLAVNHSSIEKIVHLAHQTRATNQVTVANIITSMRLLSSLDWPVFFESMSAVDRVLESDSFYSKMDFATRDRYRGVIEEIGKKVPISEVDVARIVSRLAAEAKAIAADDVKKSHVGYYLIGKGRRELEEALQWNPRFRVSEVFLCRPNTTYFGLLAVLLLLIVSGPVIYASLQPIGFLSLFLIFLVTLIPCSELALGILNLLLSRTIRPHLLSKLDFSDGVPAEAVTMVVIPCMLSGNEEIHELLEKLEIHFLGNSDRRITFALLTDFVDSTTETQDGDEHLIAAVKEGILALNKKHAEGLADRFFVFHRKRKWNSSEEAWIGWERKRGKIAEFNALLRGAKNTSFYVATAPPSVLKPIRFVITLDADTQLPRDSARKLIGTIFHPLNRARVDKTSGRVVEGYGVIQPSIGISLESSAGSLFSRTYSGFTGIDPYTSAVSEVYQDLFREGCYTGKGIYEVDTFATSLESRAPDNSILSHDLFEGLYARTGLVTDIELLDDYPQGYRSFFARQHRWTRGDWQISGWIFPWVRNQRNLWVRNQLPLVSRWKLLDNLRRSLVAPTTFLWLVGAFTSFPGSPRVWVEGALFIVCLPNLVQAMTASHGYTLRTRALQIIFYIIFLAHQSVIQADAIVRVAYRKLISRKHLLEWTSAAQSEASGDGAKPHYWSTTWPTELLLLGILLVIGSSHRPSPLVGTALVLLWMAYPFVGSAISRNSALKKNRLKPEDRLLFRQFARRTWHYFETFVGAGDHWLPPDNYQESPEPKTAHRTSPTNVGLYLLSLISARDLGYLTTAEFMARMKLTLMTLRKLEQHEGHYLNWYDTETLSALIPKYVSTADSGNLAAHLVVVHQYCLEIPEGLLIDRQILEGLSDLMPPSPAELPAMVVCRRLLTSAAPESFSGWTSLLAQVSSALECAGGEPAAISVRRRILKIESELLTFIPWTAPRFSDLAAQLAAFSKPLSVQWGVLLRELDRNRPLQELFTAWDSGLEKISKIVDQVDAKQPLSETLSALMTELRKARVQIADLLDQSKMDAAFSDEVFKAMNFGFLLDPNRRVFSVGYNLTEGKLDPALYDLLASEARLASFVSIAKGDVRQEHWFRLGRQRVSTNGGIALVSWTASMFEYLMPLLVVRNYGNTLLDETSHSIVARQINYGHKRRVPWGVSESGCNARDPQMNYQYGPFGVPGLGLKRGLGQDLVISPYATFLAALVNPLAAITNLRRLMREGLLQEYGFYEAVDYTPVRLPEGDKFAVIRSFMTHHQGMSLAVVNNLLNDGILQKRFHAEPRVRATRLLLQERIPGGFAHPLPKVADLPLDGRHSNPRSFLRDYTNPNESNPRIHLLSNRTYSVMISTAGTGYSKCGDTAVTRWREDVTRDPWGTFIFIRDQAHSRLWTTGYQPFAEMPDSYRVTFGEEKVEFRRTDGDISTYTQIIVAPEDNVEIRHVTFTNDSIEPRTLEVTSYLEPVLGNTTSDTDHPAFSKLFIETEYLPTKMALLAKRRKQTSLDKENWGLHVVATDGEPVSDIEYETDRGQFIGRGRDLQTATALSNGKLSNTSGATLDPIFSLRIQVRVPPKGKTKVAFTTGFSSTREEALELADRYHDIHSFERESKMAWTKMQADMTHLDIDSDTAYLYQQLARRILFAQISQWPSEGSLKFPSTTAESLWPHGISGDFPIASITIKDQKDIASVHQFLRGHEYLRLKGLVYDLVIINESGTTYLQDVQDLVQLQIRATGSQVWLNKPGGVFILRTDITPEKDIAHIHSIARLSLAAERPLADQINQVVLVESNVPKFVATLKAENRKERPPTDSLSELDFFNGFGGFGKEGKEYVIRLKPGEWTPAPWLNVVGNRRGFGFQVSEAGSGFTWAINSQINRLTPWSNDPVSDPSGEIVYLRDEETGVVWTPTPLPIRGEAPFTIRHGQGYSTFEHLSNGIEQSMTLFVPTNEPIKISFLTLKNQTDRKRKISVTSYTEWVLGSEREKTGTHLLCELDQSTGAIFAKNPYGEEFRGQVAFADVSSAHRTFTCSRKEFLGRNGNYSDPEGMKRESLSGKTGTGLDPCAALQTLIVLEAGETKEIAILLGQCESVETARALTLHYRNLENVKTALKTVVDEWGKITSSIQVITPDLAMNHLTNGWLLYQALSCRYWSRTAFYQSGGAYGYRDQLQDCMAFIYSDPSLTREHLLRAAGRQFKEGDVQHWWHPPTGKGLRTRISDDLLWLPFVVNYYVEVTGDKSILEEKVRFLDAPLLKPGQNDAYSTPIISDESVTLFEHCIRAIDHSLSFGSHGLPLMGTGDWNDGMNQVGAGGKGESIWLGWFLSKILADFIPTCTRPEQRPVREKYAAHLKDLKQALEKEAWDGDWYKRAFFDDGSPVGSAMNQECRIDSIAQSWAALSGVGDVTRTERAMEKVSELLVREKAEIVLLFTPPFDRSIPNPGYIQGYVPGIRENGGQYTHGAVWAMMAYAKLGDGEKAFELYEMLNPILHSRSESAAREYRIEPYVVAGDVYSGAHEGRGGWSWYTGAAAWYYRGGIESLLGFRLRGNLLEIVPCIPKSWGEYEISYRYGNSPYRIRVNNPEGLNRGVSTVTLDGRQLATSVIPLDDDGKEHIVSVILKAYPSVLNPQPSREEPPYVDPRPN